jgi:hypothetical protein
MLTKRHQFVIVLLASLVVGLMWIDSSENPRQYQIQNQRNSKSADNSIPITSDERIANYTGWVAAFTAALVGTSIIQGGFLFWANWLTRKNLTTAFNIERPYLVIRACNFKKGHVRRSSGKWMLVPNIPLIVEFNVGNVGRTVAFVYASGATRPTPRASVRPAISARPVSWSGRPLASISKPTPSSSASKAILTHRG